MWEGWFVHARVVVRSIRITRGRVCVRGGVSGRAFSRGVCVACHACPLCESRVRSPLCVLPSSTAPSLSVSCPVRIGPVSVRSKCSLD